MLLDIARTPGKELFPPSYVISGNELKGFEFDLNCLAAALDDETYAGFTIWFSSQAITRWPLS